MDDGGECLGCGGVGNWCDCGEDDEDDQVVVVEGVLPSPPAKEREQLERPSDDGGSDAGPVAQV